MPMNLLFYLLCILLNVAFVTLFERKILGLSQARIGPNKVGSKGALQPFADAVKLFSKKWVHPYKVMSVLFLFAPLLGLFIMILIWCFMPLAHPPVNPSVSGIFILMVMSMNIYPLLFAGWASNSKLAMIGALRGVAQTISYEISLALILFSFMLVPFSLSLESMVDINKCSPLALGAIPMIYVWVISCVAETNRTPFDFAEGESELVSGFNTEFGGGGFAVIFMSEYGMILFFSMMTGLIAMGPHTSLLGLGSFLGLVFFWMWIRSTFPRYRYDKLMSLCWKFVLPLALLGSVSSLLISGL